MSYKVNIEGGMQVTFEEVFQEFYPSMCACAYRFVRDRLAVEDIVQEVFILFWNRQGVYKTMADVKTFLYVAVKNRCLNYLRDHKESVDLDAVEVQERDGMFRDWVVEEEVYRLIDRAIDSLSPQSAKVIRLAIDGMQNKEIAEELNVSVNTVKTLKYNALEKLREMLKDHFYIVLWLVADSL